jgi:hypothetical protein
MPKTLGASPKVQRAAQRLVEYLEHDEYRDFLGELPRDHIFHAVRTVRDWLGMAPLDADEAATIADARAEAREERRAS